MELQKNTTIEIGNRISLSIGVNWGAIIKRKLFFGLIPVWENVNLDICVAMFDCNGQMQDMIHPARLCSRDGSVIHSGDDRTGDRFGDDDLDNETITIDFDKLGKDIHHLFFFLVSANKKDFSRIPYSKVRIYEGDQKQVFRMFGSYNISAHKAYAGKIAMVMGKLFLEDGQWKFHTIGEGLESEKLLSSVLLIKEKFVKKQFTGEAVASAG